MSARNKKSYTKKELEAEIERVYDAHGVVIEQIEDKIDAVAEGYQSLDEKMDRNLKEIKKKIGGIDKRTIILEGSVDKLGNKVDKLGNKVDKLENDMEIVKTEVRLIRDEQISRDEFDLLERRADRIEKVLAR